MSRFHRRPSVVFKESLALDPSVDLLGHRLPHAMLDTSDRGQSEEKIEHIAANLGPRGVVLLFPEGGNFTPERRRAALRNLHRRGKDRSAEKAQRMSHVLPPRPSGSLAALGAKRDADVIFAAHTGLGRAADLGQFWRDMPIGRTFYSRMWLVPASEVPVTDDEQIAGYTTGGSRSTSGSTRAPARTSVSLLSSRGLLGRCEVRRRRVRRRADREADPLVERLGRQRLAEVVALREVAAQPLEAVQRRLVLNSFGDDRQPEVVAQVDRRADDDQSRSRRSASVRRTSGRS